MVGDMDLTPWAHGGVVEVRVVERTIAGGYPGTVIHCIREVEHADGTTELLERRFAEEGFVLAAFEAFVRDFNKALWAKRKET
jgi:hypothetical protein